MLDSDFDLPQHLFAGLADRRTQLDNGIPGVEIKDTQEILVPEVFIRVQATAGQQGIGDADSSGAAECRAGVKHIIPLQERAVNDTEDIHLMAVPIFCCQPECDVFQLRRKAVPAGDLKASLQRRRHHRVMLWPVLPEVGIQSVVPTARVRYVEHIPEYRPALTGVNQGDAL